jgi:hypothetical protein
MLRQREVQLDTCGRELGGRADAAIEVDEYDVG